MKRLMLLLFVTALLGSTGAMADEPPEQDQSTNTKKPIVQDDC